MSVGVSSARAVQISPQELNEVNENRDRSKLIEYGGPEGVTRLLSSNKANGLDLSPSGPHSLEERQEKYGANKLPARKGKNLFVLIWEQLKDPTLILLMAAAMVSLVIGVAVKKEREEGAWSEGVAIWVAVLVVSLVGAGNDFQKDKQFEKLNEAKNVIEIKVMRDGKEKVIPNLDIVVGDILLLDTGDKVVADGLCVESFGLVLDEASLTGESEPLAKDPSEDPWCRSGTQVTEGSGKIVVTAVGIHSEWGKTMALVSGESHDTPLQEALGWLAAAIGKVGLTVGVLCFVVLMIRWMIQFRGFPASEIANGPLNYFIFAVTIVVVAVPEGLPLAVTISLAYSMKKMMKDNNFVRVLAACETMGGATAVCSDKTGTLTENRMTVTAGWFADRLWEVPPTVDQIPPETADAIKMNIALNSKAFLIEAEDSDTVEFVGNRTECALLVMLKDWGFGYKDIRDQNHDSLTKLYQFTSERKMASAMYSTKSGFRLYNKGAAEIVVGRCSHYLDSTGASLPMSEDKRSELKGTVTKLAQQGLRTLCLTYRDFPASTDPTSPAFDLPPEDDLTAICIVGIKDPVRKEVPRAVEICTHAGIFVRMVTGDNIHTAKHIAKECGILTEDGLALDGPEFRKMPEAEIIPLLPKLQVLARSSPTDKYTLVSLLRKQGEVVAVTGDGTNDAPALKEADVGLAMGIAGTEVAKEAADIVIMDDNFNSIVKSVLWGRSVFSNLRKFLQFQLTINGVALVVAFVAAVTSGQTPLNVIQLLWVNLIMDSLAALALATELPSDDLLDEVPHGRNEALINGAMWRQILGQVFYQITILFIVIYGAPTYIKRFGLPAACPTYGMVDASGIDVSALNTGVNALYNPPQNTTYSVEKARCSKGPCVDLCCRTNATGYCETNLVSQGGQYLDDDKPVCSLLTETDKWGTQLCKIERVRRRKSDFCPEGQSSCARADQFQKLDDQGNTQYEEDIDHKREDFNSIVFNAFIFMQIFNLINARKIRDEYNIFSGLWQSKMFIYVGILILGFQLVIMFTVVRNFFHVDTISWEGWLFSVLTGLGVWPTAFLIRVWARTIGCGCMPAMRWKSKVRVHPTASTENYETRQWTKPKTWIKKHGAAQLPS